MRSDFYKNDPADKIWWTDDREETGKMEFSFDKKKIFNVWTDYPDNLTKEQKGIFDKENPELAKLLEGR